MDSDEKTSLKKRKLVADDEETPRAKKKVKVNGASSQEEASSDESEFDDGYEDDLMGDDDDREMLEAMTEKERETVLFKRAERRDELKKRWDIATKLKNSRQDSNAMYEPGSSAGERSRERKKTVEVNKTKGTISNALAQLKASRQKKQNREIFVATGMKSSFDNNKLNSTSSSIKLKTRDIYSDDSDSEDNGPQEYVVPLKRIQHSAPCVTTELESFVKPSYVSTIEEMESLRITRNQLFKFMDLPFFEDLVVGCFVRVSIGCEVYRCAEIMKVIESTKVYNFAVSNASRLTNKGFLLKHGYQKNVLRLEFVSNQHFTQLEFDKWKSDCEKYSVEMPTLDLIEQKKKEIQKALDYEFKEEDIDRIINEKNRFRAQPINTAMLKSQLLKDRAAAILELNDEKTCEITKKLQELEDRANKIDRHRTSFSSISIVNDRNRKRNLVESEKAIREEKIANKGQIFSDPFTRRSTRPKNAFNLHVKVEKDIIMEPEISRVTKHIEERNKTWTSSVAAYSMHDFDIDVNVESPEMPIVTEIPSQPANHKVFQPTNKKSLNLEDYKKRNGFI